MVKIICGYFLDAFRQNGKSEGTIEQYQLHLSRMLSYVGKNVEDIEDDDLIEYMEKNISRFGRCQTDT